MENREHAPIKEPSELTGLIGELKNPLLSVQKRKQVVSELSQIRESGDIKVLGSALNEPLKYSTQFFEDVALSLGQTRMAQAVDILISFLKDQSSIRRLAAANGLGAANDPRAVVPLYDAMNDPDLDVCMAAASSLGCIGESQAIDILVTRLHSQNPDLRKIAVHGLRARMDPQIVEYLILAIHDSDPYVRVEAAEALGESHDSRAVIPLIDALDDDFWIYSGEGRCYIVQEATTQSLRQIGKPAVAALISMLQSPDPAQRKRSAQVLGKMGDLSAVQPLRSVLDDPDSGVRLGAQHSLDELHK